MLDHLVSLIGRLGHWAYLVIFLAVTLESAAFLGFVIPGEMLVLLGGFLAAQGTLDWGDLMVLVCVGAVLGDSIGYEVGRHVDRERLLRIGGRVGLRPAHLERVEAFFRRHGGKAVFLGRFTALLRALTPFVAGSSGMPYRQFFVYNAAGGVLWGTAFVLLGYVAGASWRLVGHWLGRASALVGAALILGIVTAWLWRWTVRHEGDLKRGWASFLNRHWVMSLRRRFAPQAAFLQRRLTPGGYFGLYVTVGVLVLVAAGWLFGGIAQDVLAGDPLTGVDQRVAGWLHAHSEPSLTAVMLAVSSLGTVAVVGAIAALAAVRAAVRRDWYTLLELVLAVPGIVLLNATMKLVFARPRPAVPNSVVHLTTSSFPSGHTAAATVAYGLLAVFAVRALATWRWRVLAVLAAVLLVVAVGFSRMYLGAHYLSDVLAAAAEGVAWLAICLTAVKTLRRGRGRASPTADGSVLA